jgi:hypothetical protein
MTDSIFKKIGMVVKNYVEDIKNNLQAQINTKANQNHQHEIYQNKNNNLTDISSIVTGTGFLKKVDSGWQLDNNQQITITGDDFIVQQISNEFSLQLKDSGVVAGTYGSQTQIPQIQVDSTGRVKSITNTDVSIPSGSINVSSSDFTIIGNTGSTINNASLTNTGVVAGTYGSQTQIPQIQVDSTGRVKSIINKDVSIPSGSIEISSTDFNIIGNTGSAINDASLTNTGVVAGTYNSVTVDIKGRITAGEKYFLPFDMVQFINGKPLSGEVLVKLIAPRTITIPANMTTSYFVCDTAPTVNTVLNVYVNNEHKGTVTFSSGLGTTRITGVVASNSITLVAGDVFTLVAPTTIDTTFANFSCVICGTMNY